jgi:hypothetical protein
MKKVPIEIKFDWTWEWSFKKIVLLVILLFNILVLCGVFDKRDNCDNKSNQGNGGIPSHCEITGVKRN